MRLAAFTDYGLRILMRLADKPEEALTTQRVAKELRIPYNHLAKVVQDLARAGYVRTQRGAGGGVRLARPPQAISLGEVVRCLEQRYAMVECFRPDGGACLLMPNCRFRLKLMVARDAFLAELDKTSIAECAHPGPCGGRGGAPAAQGAG